MAKNLKVVNIRFGLIPERLSEASPSRPACAECALHEQCFTPFIKPYVPEQWKGTYLFLVDVSRGGEEQYLKNGLFLSIRERSALKAVLDETGIEKDEVAFACTLRCRPHLTGSKKPKMGNLRACRPFLIRTVQELNPYLVIACGESAVKSLMNTGSPGPIVLLRGRSISMPVQDQEPFMRIEVTSKLSSLLTDPHSRTRMIEDLKRIQLPKTPHPKKEMPNGKEKEIGFDTEYNHEQVFTIGIADTKQGITFSAQRVPTACVTRLSTSTLVGHNLSVDIEALIKCKIKGLNVALEQWLQGKRQRDTVLEARLADENRGKHGYKLETLTTALLNTKDWKKTTEDLGPDPAKWPPQLREERCRIDAWATLKIHKILEKSIEGPSRLSHAIAMSLRRLYFAGVFIDPKAFKKMRNGVHKERENSFIEVLKFAKKFGMAEGFTATDEQLRDYVYSRNGVGLEIESYTKGGLPSVSVKHLKEYKDDKAIQALITFSQFDKLQSTYCDSLAKKFVDLGTGLWMPVVINPLAAKTGRRASSSPNMQNWPVSVRKIIVSRFKNGSIADCDYNKLEPILGGWVANEPRLTEYFVKYPNGYIKIGEDFFKKTVDKTTKEYTAMKSLVLAIIYNKKKWSTAEDLWSRGVRFDSNYEKHTDESGRVLEKFLDMFPGMRTYHLQQE
ncbi:MAG: DNA polymerase, partial [Nitrososphaerales archaeon]